METQRLTVKEGGKFVGDAKVTWIQRSTRNFVLWILNLDFFVEIGTNTDKSYVFLFCLLSCSSISKFMSNGICQASPFKFCG